MDYVQPTKYLKVAMTLLAFGMPGIQELLIFMVIVLIVFGSSRLPSLMRNLGRSANEFKAGMRDPVGDDKLDDDRDDKDKKEV